jgi:GntR family transcriptional repressor for pyruvate dehydrogenase complex
VSASSSPIVKIHLRQPRLAEMVADVLRRRILSGELTDGSIIGKQEELIDEFSVSKPSIREALRILETEGLITVLRGNVGGAVVHVPQVSNAAYMLGLVLQSKRVTLRDVGNALKNIEPVCAALCADRPDRDVEVLPRLRAVHQAALDCMDTDELRFTQLTREFHEEMVALCGNQTMIQLVGALETIWSAHEQEWAKRLTQEGEFPKSARRRKSVKIHERLITLIEAGNAEAVALAARRHLEDSVFYASGDGTMSVSADTIR